MAIDVGPACSNRSSQRTGANTWIVAANTANATGLIDYVCVWVDNLAFTFDDFEAATFTNEGGNVFSTNGDSGGVIDTGMGDGQHEYNAPGDFTAFDVTTGDYAGCKQSNSFGGIEYVSAGGSGFWEELGDNIPASSVDFDAPLSSSDLSIYFEGTEVTTAPPSTTLAPTTLAPTTAPPTFLTTTPPTTAPPTTLAPTTPAPTWAYLCKDGIPVDGDDATTGDYTYIYAETATLNGNITKIEMWVEDADPNGLDVAVFSRSGNNFTDEHWVQGLAVGAGYNVFVEGVDYNVGDLPIVIGEYFGWYQPSGASMSRQDDAGVDGYLFDQGDQIGDGNPSAFTVSQEAGGRQCQVRCTIGFVTTAPPTTLAPTTPPPTTLAPTTLPTTAAPTTLAPTTLPPTTEEPTDPPTTLAPTTLPTTTPPTTLAPTTEEPTPAPTTLAPTTLPTTAPPTTLAPTTLPTTAAPTTLPTTAAPTTLAPTTLPTTPAPTTLAPTTIPTTSPPTTLAPTTLKPTIIMTSLAPTTEAPTTIPTTTPPTTLAPTTLAPTTIPTTTPPTTSPPTTLAPTTLAPTTLAPTTAPIPPGIYTLTSMGRI